MLRSLDFLCSKPSISLILVVRDSADALPDLLADVLAQDLPRVAWEFLVVDGISSDGTPELVARTLSTAPDVQWRLLANPRRTLAPGWNIGLGAARGEAMVRVDAHARIAPTFLRRCVEALAAGDDIVGGPVVTLPPLGRRSLLHAVESSHFAGAAAGFRRTGPPRYVDTLAYAAYRRYVFAICGGLDERLRRNQDNELHARLRRAGFRFRYDPSISSHYRMRATWRAVLEQKFRNGVWVALASAVRPGCFAARHLLPFVFVVALLMAAGLLLAGPGWWPLSGLVALHLATGATYCWRDRVGESASLRWRLLLPPTCLLVHVVYGAGTLLGLGQAPLFRWRHRGYRLPFPVGTATNATRGEPCR